MEYSLNQRLRKASLAISVLPFYVVSNRGFLSQMGWFRTLRTGLSTDGRGNPIPWWSYGCVLFLQERLHSKLRVFEYGSGYSTIWLANRVGTVISVETVRHWYEKIKMQTPQNVELLHHADYVADGEYCRIAQGYGPQFDIVVVDSRDRVRCAKNSIDALSPSGVLIFDDAHQPHLQEARDFLAQKGFRNINFFGMGPLNDGTHCTTIFYRDTNCLGL